MSADAPRPAFVHTARTDARACPICHRTLDAATGVSLEPDDPHPELEIGSVTCCAYCGTVLTLTTIGFRVATAAELEAIDPTLRRLLFEFSASRSPSRRDA